VGRMDEARFNKLVGAAETRQKAVFDLHFAQGLTVGDIANRLEIDPAIIDHDIDAIRASKVNQFRDADLLETLSIDAAVLRHIRELAVSGFHDSVESISKHEFLKTAVMASDTRWHLLAAIFNVIEDQSSSRSRQAETPVEADQVEEDDS
jgi:hypothetical protein